MTQEAFLTPTKDRGRASASIVPLFPPSLLGPDSCEVHRPDAHFVVISRNYRLERCPRSSHFARLTYLQEMERRFPPSFAQGIHNKMCASNPNSDRERGIWQNPPDLFFILD